MDTVTYPDEIVRQELESWVFQRFDASQHPVAATELGVRAVPAAIALEGSTILGRKENFVEPADFVRWLRDRRSPHDH